MSGDGKIKDLHQSRLNALFLESRKVFSTAYAENKRPSALIAREIFDELAENRDISIDDGFRILKDKGKVQVLLQDAEGEYQKNEFGLITKILSDLVKNTSLKAAIISGLVSSTIVGLFFYALPYVANPNWRQGGKDISSPKEQKATVASAPTEQAPSVVNYYFYFNNPAASNAPTTPKKKGERRKQKAKFGKESTPSPAP